MAALAQPLQRFTYPLFPLKVGQRWTYRRIDLKSPQAKADPKKLVVIEVAKETPFQRTTFKDKEIKEQFVGYQLKMSSGDKAGRESTFDQVVVLADGIYRVQTAGMPTNPPLPFFKIPQNKGAQSWEWECDCTSGNTPVKGKFTGSHDRVAVKGQLSEAVKVVFRSADGTIETETWFVNGIGMVKQHIKNPDHDVVLELEEFRDVK